MPVELEPVHEACAIGLPDEVFEKSCLLPSFKTDFIHRNDLVEKCRVFTGRKESSHRIIILGNFRGVSGKVQLNQQRMLVKQQSAHMLIHGSLYEMMCWPSPRFFQVPVSALSIRDTANHCGLIHWRPLVSSLHWKNILGPA
jgi:hypothetical protein